MKVVNTNKLPVAPITSFVPTQGNLKFLSKDNYDKLKSSIERRGFYLPVMVWVDEDGTKWLLDGHQRKHVLETERWNDPIPYLIVEAATKEEAAERLLEITSQYGTITQEGLDEYIAKFQLPEVDVLNHTNFDAIFNFSIEPEVEEEPEFEVEPEVEEPLIRFEVRLTEGLYKVKSVINKKSNFIGEFENKAEVAECLYDAVEEWEA